MSKIQYKYQRLQKKTLNLVFKANEIIEEYQEQGFELTVRQIYYQFVTRGLIENSMKSYLLIGRILNQGRMCGYIDWNAIVDRTRNIYKNSHWDSPKDILEAAAQRYKLDTRADQPYYIEVWIEKNALLGVIEPICQKLDVLYLPCIGYYSLSAMWRAANRFKIESKPSIIFHLGDHDPSGIQMTEDIQNRLDKFGVEDVTVKRIALNLDQVKKYNPPPNFAKESDSRAAEYIVKFGRQSWELDALSPSVITKLIKTNVDAITNKKKIAARQALQAEQRTSLHDNADEFEDE